jgi:hypothetical protein
VVQRHSVTHYGGIVDLDPPSSTSFPRVPVPWAHTPSSERQAQRDRRLAPGVAEGAFRAFQGKLGSVAGQWTWIRLKGLGFGRGGVRCEGYGVRCTVYDVVVVVIHAVGSREWAVVGGGTWYVVRSTGVVDIGPQKTYSIKHFSY